MHESFNESSFAANSTHFTAQIHALPCGVGRWRNQLEGPSWQLFFSEDREFRARIRARASVSHQLAVGRAGPRSQLKGIPRHSFR